LKNLKAKIANKKFDDRMAYNYMVKDFKNISVVLLPINNL